LGNSNDKSASLVFLFVLKIVMIPRINWKKTKQIS